MGRYSTVTAMYDNQIYGLSTTVVDTATISYWLDKAELEIDSYLAKQYVDSMPFTPVIPKMLTSLSQDLTACKLYNNYLFTQDNQNTNDWVEGLCTDVYDILTKLSTDEIRLSYGDTGEANSGTVISPNVNINMKSSMNGISLAADMDDPLLWEVSQNLLDTIGSGREANG